MLNSGTRRLLCSWFFHSVSSLVNYTSLVSMWLTAALHHSSSPLMFPVSLFHLPTLDLFSPSSKAKSENCNLHLPSLGGTTFLNKRHSRKSLPAWGQMTLWGTTFISVWPNPLWKQALSCFSSPILLLFWGVVYLTHPVFLQRICTLWFLKVKQHMVCRRKLEKKKLQRWAKLGFVNKKCRRWKVPDALVYHRSEKRL